MLAEVRSACAEIAATARHVRIDLGAFGITGGRSGLDPSLHLLDGSPEEIARYVFVLDATNFGSGWFDELGVDTDELTRRLTGCFREGRPIDFGLPAGHELTRLYAEALRQLEEWLGGRPALASVGDSAEDLAVRLCEMPFFRDPGFYKRAQITANDLVLAGVAEFPDVDRLTVFADNLLPHVLRCEGVLVYDDELAIAVDAGEVLEHGGRMEVEIRACALHACAQLAPGLGVSERTLDNWLWNRGRELPPGAHVTRTTAY
jgi:hypothetical protein